MRPLLSQIDEAPGFLSLSIPAGSVRRSIVKHATQEAGNETGDGPVLPRPRQTESLAHPKCSKGRGNSYDIERRNTRIREQLSLTLRNGSAALIGATRHDTARRSRPYRCRRHLQLGSNNPSNGGYGTPYLN
jgi:hypothetical protein